MTKRRHTSDNWLESEDEAIKMVPSIKKLCLSSSDDPMTGVEDIDSTSVEKVQQWLETNFTFNIEPEIHHQLSRNVVHIENTSFSPQDLMNNEESNHCLKEYATELPTSENNVSSSRYPVKDIIQESLIISEISFESESHYPQKEQHSEVQDAEEYSDNINGSRPSEIQENAQCSDLGCSELCDDILPTENDESSSRNLIKKSIVLKDLRKRGILSEIKINQDLAVEDEIPEVRCSNEDSTELITSENYLYISRYPAKDIIQEALNRSDISFQEQNYLIRETDEDKENHNRTNESIATDELNLEISYDSNEATTTNHDDDCGSTVTLIVVDQVTRNYEKYINKTGRNARNLSFTHPLVGENHATMSSSANKQLCEICLKLIAEDWMDHHLELLCSGQIYLVICDTCEDGQFYNVIEYINHYYEEHGEVVTYEEIINGISTFRQKYC